MPEALSMFRLFICLSTHMCFHCCWTEPPGVQNEGSWWCHASGWCQRGTRTCSDPHKRLRSRFLNSQNINRIWMRHHNNFWISVKTLRSTFRFPMYYDHIIKPLDVTIYEISVMKIISPFCRGFKNEYHSNPNKS